MVASHGKLRALFLRDEVVQPAFLRELVPQSHTVVVDAEANVHQSFCLFLLQFYEQFVVVVADVVGLAPDGLPRLVECCGLFSHQRESIEQIVAIQQFIAKAAGKNDVLAAEGYMIGSLLHSVMPLR